MDISIFGLGYVGCVSLGCLAERGHKVIGVDVNIAKVNHINQGKPTIIENGLEAIIQKHQKLGNISATNDGSKAIKNSQISIICVGTPSTDNGHLSLNAIFSVCNEIGEALRYKEKFHVIVIRSTVLPGTNEKVTKIIEESSGKQREKEFTVVSNPEFLREGSALEDYHNPAYTIIGSENEVAVNLLKEMYQGIEAPFIVTEIKIAEFIKYVNNAFHACKVVFANEIGNICKKIDINSHKLMDIFCQDKKLNISPYYLRPGFCYGGSCLPKDLKALKTIAHDNYLECTAIESIEKSNEIHKKVVLDHILQLGKEKLGFLGLSFKGGTDDLRSSPIVDIIEKLIGKGFDIRIYDKNLYLAKLLGANKEYILKKIPYISKFIISSDKEFIDHSDLLIVVNKEKEYEQILNKIPNNKLVYDLVNINFERKSFIRNYSGLAW